MRIALYLLAGALALMATLPGSTFKPIENDLQKTWKIIDSLENQGLYRSALDAVNLIYRDARSRSDQPNEIKALIYRMKYQQELSEEGRAAAILEMHRQLPDNRPVVEALKYSLLAELYYRYYSVNRWEILQNPPEAPEASQTGITTETLKKWSPEQFFQTISGYYGRSVAEPAILAKAPVSSFGDLFTGSPADTLNQPTLYDILMKRAVDFSSSLHEFPIFRLKPPILCQENLFNPAGEFIAAVRQADDDPNNPWLLTLNWYASWLEWRLAALSPQDQTNTGSRAALLTANLSRLRYVRENACHPKADSLYRLALVGQGESLENDSLQARVFLELGRFHAARSDRFVPNSRDTSQYKSDRKEAVAWLEKANRWSQTIDGKESRNLLNNLLQPVLRAELVQVQLPGQYFPVSLWYQNTKTVFYQVYPFSALNYYSNWLSRQPEDRLHGLTTQVPIRSGRFQLPDDGDLNAHQVNVILDPLPVGFHLLVWSAEDAPAGDPATTSLAPVTVSRIGWVTRPDESGGREFHFRDRDSGAPLPSVRVIPWYQIWDDRTRNSVLEGGRGLLAGKDGFLSIPAGGPGQNDPARRAYRIQAIAGRDTLVSPDLFYPGYGRTGRKAQTTATIHTDRTLYKPGQTLFFRGVLIDRYPDSLAIHRADSVVVTLQDPRYQAIESISVPVDPLGSFTGAFQLPLKGLTGNYFLQTSHGQARVRMEQYRRPGFDIKVDPDRRVYLEGDQISVSGSLTALSGEPVPDAEITVEVDIQAGVHPVRWNPWAGQQIRVHSERIRGDAGGRFDWKWTTLPARQNPYSPGGISRYRVTLRATDPNGETQVEELTIDCGRESLRFGLELPSSALATDSIRITGNAFSSDGRHVTATGTIRVEKLAMPDAGLLNPLIPLPDRFIYTPKEWTGKLKNLPYCQEHQIDHWPVVKTLYRDTIRIDSSRMITLPPAGNAGAGWYRVFLSPDDTPAGTAVIRHFYLEPVNPTRIPPGQPLWAKPASGQLKVGDQFQLSLAFPEKSYCLIEIQLRNETLTTKWLQAGSKMVALTWPVTEQWQGGARVRIVGIRDGRTFHKDLSVLVPWINKNLDITGLQVPEKVEPGDTIRLKIKVMDENGSPVSGSMGVTVYDASLDRIAPHDWSRLTWPGVSARPTWESAPAVTSRSETLYSRQIDWVWAEPVSPLEFNWFGMGYYGIGRFGEPMMMKSAVADRGSGRVEEAALNAQATAGGEGAVAEDAALPSTGDAPADDAALAPVQIRSDFRETALFDGQILTGADGSAELEFTVPEVFTEWRILAAVHDKNLANGYYSGIFASAKDLMIRSNFPPFLRSGDTVDLAARVGWYGSGSIRIVTSLALTDASANQVMSYDPLESVIQKGASVPYYWRFSPTGEAGGAIRYQLVSRGDGTGDGLTDTIPIYPDNVRLWKSEPFFFNTPGRRSLTVGEKPLEALMEITTTPVWQVIQSLPEVVTRERDCSEYWFSRFYLANLTGFIARSFPDIAEWFMSEPVEVILDSLSHPLLRNADIKGTNWESTIWSPIRKTEEARIKQIKEWMDPEKLAGEVAYSFEKLTDLQRPDGTWPWFRGMGPDWFITQQILAGFGELKAWQVIDITRMQRGNSMIIRAIESMDSWLSRQLEELTRVDSTLKQEVQLNPLVINYLYSRAYFVGLSQSPRDEIAYLYFMDRMGQEWVKHEAPLQVLMAITQAQVGRMAGASTIYRSIRERMASSPEMGLYWPRKGYASAWYHWDIWMQSRLIELFAAVEEGRGELDQLRLYLLHQKRGRDWGNGMVAGWAAKSLLFYGSALLQQPAVIGFNWGGEQFSPLRVRTGSVAPNGYYRYGWKDPAEMPNANKLEVRHEGGGPAWGALYTLNSHQLDELAATDGPLKIGRTLMIRNQAGQWTDYRPGTDLMVGQVVRVRLTITSDRDLSYLELKDHLGTGFVPVGVLSGYHYQQGLSWYQAREPEAVLFYLHTLPRGTHTIEYQAVPEQSGRYFGGYSTLQSLYAPEFRAWSGGVRVSAGR
ncbi:MAG: MG2 domain-containing protein [Bacteroidales bacterium]